jgi:GntR family transcriptional regulator, transcriptional repressor for pyruvate dehydrogenase complex
MLTQRLVDEHLSDFAANTKPLKKSVSAGPISTRIVSLARQSAKFRFGQVDKWAVTLNMARNDRSIPSGNQDITVQLISSFKNLISEGKFVPGCKLPPERALAKRFGVNRSSLRQALKVLQLMGVLSQRVGDGTYLNTDAAKILHEPIEFLIIMGDLSHEELFEARLIVESELTARATERATSHDLADLRRAISDMENSQSDQARIDADLAFHEAIFRASGNRVCHMIFTVIHRAILVSMARIAKRVDVEHPLKFHKAIYSAIYQRKPDEARRKMIEHLVDAKSLLLSADAREAGKHLVEHITPIKKSSKPKTQ